LVPKVNPHEYEAIIEYCIEYGKMGGEEKIYYLLQGLDCGLLEYPDRMMHFDSKKLNEYPILEILASATGGGKTRPSREDLRNWAKIDGDKNAPGDDFNQWFWTYASHAPRVLQRADKTLSQGTNRMDHDDVTATIAFVESSTIKQMLKLSYGGEYGLPATGFGNMSVAYLQYIDNWAKNAEYIDNSVEHLKRFVNAFTSYYSVTRGRMWKKKDYFRFTETSLNDPNGPRAVGIYKTHGKARGVKTTKQFMDKTKDLMSVLDQELFSRLFDEKISASTDEGKKYVRETVAWIKQRYGDPNIFGVEDPKTYDELIDVGLPKIVEVLMSGDEGKARIKNLIKQVKTDIGSTVGEDGLTNFGSIIDSSHYHQDNFAEIRDNNIKNLPVENYNTSGPNQTPGKASNNTIDFAAASRKRKNKRDQNSGDIGLSKAA
ncbi:hypothetical protein KKG71_02845, partial [Patescibacteria group bacterium]|nr:hypothetical protein [Patescibacteria group bacterium]